jgi:hypothetical protein
MDIGGLDIQTSLRDTCASRGSTLRLEASGRILQIDGKVKKDFSDQATDWERIEFRSNGPSHSIS